MAALNPVTSGAWKILYVDDDIERGRQKRQFLEAYCQSLGTPCNFTVVSNPYSALEYLESSKYHLCILQYDLSDFDSCQFVQIAGYAAPHMPFIAMLPESELFREFAKTQLNHIFAGFLFGVFEEEDLREAITSILRIAS